MCYELKLVTSKNRAVNGLKVGDYYLEGTDLSFHKFKAVVLGVRYHIQVAENHLYIGRVKPPTYEKLAYDLLLYLPHYQKNCVFHVAGAAKRQCRFLVRRFLERRKSSSVLVGINSMLHYGKTCFRVPTFNRLDLRFEEPNSAWVKRFNSGEFFQAGNSLSSELAC